MEKWSHTIGKFNILRVNVILFQGNQKNIRVDLSGRNNADFWFVYKKFELFPDYQGDIDFSSRTDVFLKGPLFSKSTLKLARFNTKFVVGRKILVRPYRAGKFGKFGFKVLFVSCAFILRVAEAPADHESTNEQDFRGCCRGDKPVFIEEINK